MTLRASGRIFPGFTLVGSGGGGGGTTNEILTAQALIAGDTDIAHTLGVEPTVVMFNDTDGKTMVLDWVAKVGSETTVITVTSLKIQTVNILLAA